jgi:hypothetical protein
MIRAVRSPRPTSGASDSDHECDAPERWHGDSGEEKTTMNAALPSEPCAHPGCGCKVGDAQTYCSDYCRQQATRPDADGECACGHSDCIVEEALRRVEQDD